MNHIEKIISIILVSFISLVNFSVPTLGQTNLAPYGLFELAGTDDLAGDSAQLIEGDNSVIPKRGFYGRIDNIVIIADYSRTVAPKMILLEGKYLEAFVDNLQGSDLVVITTGDHFDDIERCLIKPLLKYLRDNRRKLLNKLIVQYDSSAGTFHVTPQGKIVHLWKPKSISEAERKRFTTALIEAFWEEIEKQVKKPEMLEHENIDAIIQRQLKEFKENIATTDEWKKVEALGSYKFHLTPIDSKLGNIFIADSGGLICLEFDNASKSLLEVLGGSAYPLSRPIARLLDARVKKATINRIVAGPSYVDIAQTQKDDGVKRLFRRNDIKKNFNKGKTAFIFMGDSRNDFHLNLTDEDFQEIGINAITIPVFVGKDRDEANQFTKEPIITIPVEADGGALTFTVFANAKGKDLSDLIVPSKKQHIERPRCANSL